MNGTDLGGGICTHSYKILCKNIPMLLMFLLRILLLRSSILYRPSPIDERCWRRSSPDPMHRQHPTADSPCHRLPPPASRSPGSASPAAPLLRGTSSTATRTPSQVLRIRFRRVCIRSEDPRHRVVAE
ncbi:hypothetical protein VPH35_062831 [Triticum aestivum]|uniref:Uncharacterized protein n=1 Tax=Aegilops tauschii subsp. strangulata TaxID=200361 RepID=A0A453GI75_AEGTS